MFSTHRLRRLAIVGALTCALPATAIGSVANVQIDEQRRLDSARQQQRYYASFPELDRDPRGEYYTSYGHPEPLAAPKAPAASDDGPWQTIAIAVAAALATAAMAATQRRRLRFRRRSASATT
jgi:hypothetical protein